MVQQKFYMVMLTVILCLLHTRRIKQKQMLLMSVKALLTMKTIIQWQNTVMCTSNNIILYNSLILL